MEWWIGLLCKFCIHHFIIAALPTHLYVNPWRSRLSFRQGHMKDLEVHFCGPLGLLLRSTNAYEVIYDYSQVQSSPSSRWHNAPVCTVVGIYT